MSNCSLTKLQIWPFRQQRKNIPNKIWLSETRLWLDIMPWCLMTSDITWALHHNHNSVCFQSNSALTNTRSHFNWIPTAWFSAGPWRCSCMVRCLMTSDITWALHHNHNWVCFQSNSALTNVLLRLRVQNRRKKWNFPLNFRTVAYPGLLLKGPSFRVTEWSFWTT